MPYNYPGKLILFEGCEGAGKSTLIKFLASFLRSIGYKIVETREPGHNTELGQKIRQILLDPNHPEKPNTVEEELDLFIDQGRADHFKIVVIQALKSGKIILCDRSSPSTLSYQYYGRQLYLKDPDRKILTDILVRDARARQNVSFELILLLDLDPATGLKRKNPETRFEFENIDFHERVRGSYLEQARENPEIWRIIDASQSEDGVRNRTLEVLLEFLF